MLSGLGWAGAGVITPTPHSSGCDDDLQCLGLGGVAEGLVRLLAFSQREAVRDQKYRVDLVRRDGALPTRLIAETEFEMNLVVPHLTIHKVPFGFQSP